MFKIFLFVTDLAKADPRKRPGAIQKDGAFNPIANKSNCPDFQS